MRRCSPSATSRPRSSRRQRPVVSPRAVMPGAHSGTRCTRRGSRSRPGSSTSSRARSWIRVPCVSSPAASSTVCCTAADPGQTSGALFGSLAVPSVCHSCASMPSSTRSGTSSMQLPRGSSERSSRLSPAIRSRPPGARTRDGERSGQAVRSGVRWRRVTSVGSRRATGWRPGSAAMSIAGRARTNTWRQDFLTTRRSAGIRDFAVFNFRFGNASPLVVNDVLHAVARVI